MNIHKHPTEITVKFSPKKYWVRKNHFQPEWYGEYCLTYRVDMSYCGKEDQEGVLVMFLSKKQAKIFLDAGFEEIQGGVEPISFKDNINQRI